MTNEKHNITILHQRFARALFDNVAEMPRELSFKKGDILTVLQERYDSNSEWWICSLRNMVGLAPANRLEAMPVLVEANPKLKREMSSSCYDELPDPSASNNNNNYFNLPELQNIKKDDLYSIYQTPIEDVYTNPITDRDISQNIEDEHSVYQLPTDDTRKMSNTYFNIPESPGPSTYSNIGPDLVDLPAQNNKSNEYYNNRYDYSDSFSDATSTSFTDTIGSSVNSFNQLSISSSESGDLKLSSFSTSTPLRMPQEEAVSKYRNYQTETTASCNKVIEFAKARWKSEDMLKSTIKNIKVSFSEFYQNSQVLSNFASRILENSKTCGDINLTKKIWKHLQPIQEAILTTKDSLDKLETMNWNPEKIAVSVRLAVREGADSLSQVISAARNVLINIRSLGVTISGNANVLFPESSVDIDSRFDENLPISVQKTEETGDYKANLLEVMRLFGQQMKSQTEHVNETVNDFIKILSCQTQGAPSQDTVISHSKFVVRSATQLVCIAKNLTDAQIKSIPNQKIEQEGNILCNSLKLMVNKTKELLIKPETSNQNFDNLIGLLKSVKGNAKTLQCTVVDSVQSQQ